MTPCIVENKNFENYLVLSLIVGQMIFKDWGGGGNNY